MGRDAFDPVASENKALRYLRNRDEIVAQWSEDIRQGLLRAQRDPNVEYVEPFALRDMAGEKPLQFGEYSNDEATAELAILGLGDGLAFKGKKILCVGIGHSKLLSRLNGIGAECLGLDNNKMIADRSHAYNNPTMYGDAEHNPYPDDMFDRVLLKNLLNMSEVPEVILREAVRVCRPGGKVAIYPVLSFIDVGEPGSILGVSFIKWGLDLFTVEITKNPATDEAAIQALFDPDKFALKPVRHETTRKRVNGYYNVNFGYKK